MRGTRIGTIASLTVLLALTSPAFARMGGGGAMGSGTPAGQYGLPGGPPLTFHGHLYTDLPGSQARPNVRGINPSLRGNAANRPACPPQSPACNPTMQR